MSGSRVDYAASGVDLAAAVDAKGRLRALVESTFTPGVVGGFGGFGGMFRIPANAGGSVLVASADGVGTKLKVAIVAGKHDTVGHCLVNHCVNDILVQGARPLFFLDYVSFGKLEPAVAESIVAGVAAGCRENGCALIGGETAEMPGLYEPPDYDLAGFIVGITDGKQMLGPDNIAAGDVLVAMASSGLHTNGYSLARKIVFGEMGLAPTDAFPGEGATVAETLLRIHRSYLTPISKVLDRIHAMAHITGGGIPGNVDRVLPSHCNALVDRSTWSPPNTFRVLQKNASLDSEEMFRVFNMGVGMVVVCDQRDADAVIAAAAESKIDAWRCGEITKGDGRVEWR